MDRLELFQNPQGSKQFVKTGDVDAFLAATPAAKRMKLYESQAGNKVAVADEDEPAFQQANRAGTDAFTRVYTVEDQGKRQHVRTPDLDAFRESTGFDVIGGMVPPAPRSQGIMAKSARALAYPALGSVSEPETTTPAEERHAEIRRMAEEKAEGPGPGSMVGSVIKGAGEGAWAGIKDAGRAIGSAFAYDIPNLLWKSSAIIGGRDATAFGRFAKDTADFIDAKELSAEWDNPETEGWAALGPQAMRSIATNLGVSLATMGAGGVVLPVTYGLQQAYDTYQNAIDAGIDPEKARVAAIKSGLVEGGMEGVSSLFGGLKTLRDALGGAAGGETAKAVVRTFGQMMRKWMIETGVEAGTEYIQNDLETRIDQGLGLRREESAWMNGLQGAGVAVMSQLIQGGPGVILNRPGKKGALPPKTIEGQPVQTENPDLVAFLGMLTPEARKTLGATPPAQRGRMVNKWAAAAMEAPQDDAGRGALAKVFTDPQAANGLLAKIQQRATEAQAKQQPVAPAVTVDPVKQRQDEAVARVVANPNAVLNPANADAIVEGAVQQADAATDDENRLAEMRENDVSQTPEDDARLAQAATGTETAIPVSQTVSEQGVAQVPAQVVQQPAQQAQQEAPVPAPVVAPVTAAQAKEPAKAQGVESGTAAMTPDQEYDASIRTFRQASKEFSAVQKAYRAKEIDDAAFFAGKKAFDAAQTEADAAERKFIDAKNAEVPAPAPAAAPDYAKTAQALGIRYDGVQENSPEPVQFTDTDEASPAYGATFYLPAGATAEDLSAKLADKREQFAEGAKKEQGALPVKATSPRKMDNEGRPEDRKPIFPGDVFLTTEGRRTTPYPKYSTKRTTQREIITANQWLIDNAIAEASARGDDYNKSRFSNEKAKGLPPGSIAGMQEYLFGTEKPPAPRPLLKDLVPKPAQAAVPESAKKLALPKKATAKPKALPQKAVPGSAVPAEERVLSPKESLAPVSAPVGKTLEPEGKTLAAEGKPPELMSPDEYEAFEKEYDVKAKAETLAKSLITRKQLDSLLDEDGVLETELEHVRFHASSKGVRVKTYTLANPAYRQSGFYSTMPSFTSRDRDELLKWANEQIAKNASTGTYYPFDDSESGQAVPIWNAFDEKKPVSALAIDALKESGQASITLPAGYARVGDRYVFTQPAAAAAKPSALPAKALAPQSAMPQKVEQGAKASTLDRTKALYTEFDPSRDMTGMAQKIADAIDAKDADTLRQWVMHGRGFNDTTKKVVFKIIGKPVPSSMEAIGKAVDEWAGVSAETRAASDQKKNAERQAVVDTREAEAKQKKESAWKTSVEGKNPERAIEYLSGMDALRRGAAIAALNKQFRFPDGARTRREQVEKLIAAGDELETRSEPVVKPMTRTQFNRADNRQQEEHARRMREAGMKTVYVVGGFDLGKHAYDYAQHLKNATPALDRKGRTPEQLAVLSKTAAAVREATSGGQEMLPGKAEQVAAAAPSMAGLPSPLVQVSYVDKDGRDRVMSVMRQDIPRATRSIEGEGGTVQMVDRKWWKKEAPAAQSAEPKFQTRQTGPLEMSFISADGERRELSWKKVKYADLPADLKEQVDREWKSARENSYRQSGDVEGRKKANAESEKWRRIAEGKESIVLITNSHRGEVVKRISANPIEDEFESWAKRTDLDDVKFNTGARLVAEVQKAQRDNSAAEKERQASEARAREQVEQPARQERKTKLDEQVSGIKFKKIANVVKNGAGEETTLSGLAYRHMMIDKRGGPKSRNDPLRWSVSHIGTGRHIVNYTSQQDARVAAMRMADLIPADLKIAANEKNAVLPEDVMKKLRVIGKDAYGDIGPETAPKQTARGESLPRVLQTGEYNERDLAKHLDSIALPSGWRRTLSRSGGQWRQAVDARRAGVVRQGGGESADGRAFEVDLRYGSTARFAVAYELGRRNGVDVTPVTSIPGAAGITFGKDVFLADVPGYEYASIHEIGHALDFMGVKEIRDVIRAFDFNSPSGMEILDKLETEKNFRAGIANAVKAMTGLTEDQMNLSENQDVVTRAALGVVVREHAMAFLSGTVGPEAFGANGAALRAAALQRILNGAKGQESRGESSTASGLTRADFTAALLSETKALPFAGENVTASVRDKDVPLWAMGEGQAARGGNEEYERFFEMRSDFGYRRIAAFENAKKGETAGWDYPDFNRIKKIWNDYAKTGVVRDERGMDEIADNIVRLIAAMDFETQFAGHSSDGLGSSEALDEMDIEPWSEEKLNRYYDWTGLHISDYAMEPLQKIAVDLLAAKSAEEKLQLVDRVLNTIHQASDLTAENFIKGGKSRLNELSGTGEYGDAYKYAKEARYYRSPSGVIRAMTMGNQSHFFLKRYDNAAQLEEDIREEAMHRLINTLGGKAWQKIGTQVYSGMRYAQIVNEIQRNYGLKPGTEAFNHELVAKMVRDGQQNVGLWRRVLDAIVAALRQAGRDLGLKLDVSDAELRNFANRVLSAKMRQVARGGASAVIPPKDNSQQETTDERDWHEATRFGERDGQAGAQVPDSVIRGWERTLANIRRSGEVGSGTSGGTGRAERDWTVDLAGLATQGVSGARKVAERYGGRLIPTQSAPFSFYDLASKTVILNTANMVRARTSAMHELTHLLEAAGEPGVLRLMGMVDHESDSVEKYLGRLTTERPDIFNEMLAESRTKADPLAHFKQIVSSEIAAMHIAGDAMARGAFNSQAEADAQRQRILEGPMSATTALPAKATGQAPAQSARGDTKTVTPQFKAWFGDSKVVDADGNPLVVYHGTNSDFTEFKYTDDIGFHFGTKQQATKLAKKKGSVSGNVGEVNLGISQEDLDAKAPRIMAAYIKLVNPVKAHDTIWYHYKAASRALVNAGAITQEELDSILLKAKRSYRGEGFMLGKLKDLLVKKGYDGVEYYNEFEGAGKSYMVFSPTQIKSATGNSGAFDPSNPDIRYARGESTPKRSALPPKLTLEQRRAFNLGRRAVFEALKPVLTEARQQAAVRQTGALPRKAQVSATLNDVIANTDQKITGMKGMLDQIAKTVHSAEKNTAGGIKEVQTELMKLIRSVLPNEEIGAAGLKQVVNAQTFDDLVEALPWVKQQVDAWERRELRLDIKKLYNRFKDSSVIDVQYRDRIKAAMDPYVMERPSGKKWDSINRILVDTIASMSAGDETGVDLDQLYALASMTRTPLADLSKESLTVLRDQMAFLAQLGKLTLTARRASMLEQARNDARAAIFDLLPAKDFSKIIGATSGELTADDRIQNTMRAASKIASAIDMALSPVDSTLMAMSKGGRNLMSGLMRVVKHPMAAAWGRAAGRYADFQASLVDKSKELGIKNKDQWNRIGILGISEQNTGGDPQYGRKKLYNTFQTKARMEFEQREGIKATKSEEDVQSVREIIDGYIDKAISEVTPQERQMLQWLRDQMDPLLPQVNRIMRQLQNRELTKEDFYFPLMTDWDLAEASGFADQFKRYSEEELMSGPDVFRAEGGNRKTAEPGASKDRVGVGYQPVNFNAYTVVTRHMNDVLYFIEMEPVLRHLAKVVSQPEFKESMGPERLQFVNRLIDLASRHGGVKASQRIGWMDTMRNLLGAGQLAGSPSMTAVQLSQSIYGMAENGAGNTLAAAGELITSKALRDFVRSMSPVVRLRMGPDQAWREAGIGKLTKKASAIGFYLGTKLDRGTAEVNWLAAYKRALADQGIAWDSDSPVKNETAANMANAVVARTSASANPLDLPPMLSGLSGNNVSLAKTAFQFQTPLFYISDFLRRDMIQGALKEPRKALALAMAMMLAALYEYSVRQTISEYVFPKDKPAKKPTGLEKAVYRKVRENLSQQDARTIARAADGIAMTALGNLPMVGNLRGIGVYQGAGFPVADWFRSGIQGAVQAGTAETQEGRKKGLIRVGEAAAAIMPGGKQVAKAAKSWLPKKAE